MSSISMCLLSYLQFFVLFLPKLLSNMEDHHLCMIINLSSSLEIRAKLHENGYTSSNTLTFIIVPELKEMGFSHSSRNQSEQWWTSQISCKNIEQHGQEHPLQSPVKDTAMACKPLLLFETINAEYELNDDMLMSNLHGGESQVH
ncbi:hypothetical protein F4604DRAFT_1686545 [Suillus subluteus]|nr:hypothetical protein F4604DRAFT_1686545 [Suillus subluteus]